MPMRMKRAAAFTLVELMIAIAVISIGLSGVAASLYFGHIQSQHGDELAKASQYARSSLEMINTRNLINLTTPKDANGLPDATTGLNDADADPPRALLSLPFYNQDFLGYSAVDPNDKSARELANYTRKIQMERLSNDDTTPEYGLARVTVTIYWENPNNAAQPKSISTSSLLPTGD